MIPTYSAVLVTSIGKIDVYNQKNQFFNFVFRNEMRLKSYTPSHMYLFVQKIITIFSKITKPSFKVISGGISYQKRVWEDLSDITFENNNAYGHITSKLKVIVTIISNQLSNLANFNLFNAISMLIALFRVFIKRTGIFCDRVNGTELHVRHMIG